MSTPTSIDEPNGLREPLFDGDHGRLGVDARRALVRLLKSTHLTARTHPEEWSALLAEREAVAAVLNELFLVLEVDEVAAVAWKSQAQAEGTTFTTLLTQRRLSPAEMRVLLRLRMLLDESGPTGAQAVTVRGGDLLDALAGAYPDEKGDHVSNREQDKAALRRLAKDDVIVPRHGQSDDDPEHVVYAVSGIVETLMSPDRIVAFAQALRTGIEDPEDAADTIADDADVAGDPDAEDESGTGPDDDTHPDPDPDAQPELFAPTDEEPTR